MKWDDRQQTCICNKVFGWKTAQLLEGPLYVSISGNGGENFVVINKITGATCARSIKVSMDTYKNYTFEWIISTTIDEGEEGYDAESPEEKWKEVIRIPFQSCQETPDE